MRPKLIFIDDGDRVLMRILLAACIMAILLFPITGKALTVEGFGIKDNWKNGTEREFLFPVVGEIGTKPYYVLISSDNPNIEITPNRLWVKATERQEVRISITSPVAGHIIFTEQAELDTLQFGSEIRFKVCVNLPCPSYTNVIQERTTTSSYSEIVQTTVPSETVVPTSNIRTDYIEPIPTYVFVIAALLVCLTICIGLLVLVLVRRKTDDARRI